MSMESTEGTPAAVYAYLRSRARGNPPVNACAIERARANIFAKLSPFAGRCTRAHVLAAPMPDIAQYSSTNRTRKRFVFRVMELHARCRVDCVITRGDAAGRCVIAILPR